MEACIEEMLSKIEQRKIDILKNIIRDARNMRTDTIEEIEEFGEKIELYFRCLIDSSQLLE
jgi:hypothetical protein